MHSPKRVFFDAMILRFAIAEEPATVKKTLLWGGREVTVDLATTAPRRKREDWLQHEIDCLPRIAGLIRESRIESYVNAELRLEVACLKYGGLVCSELSVFHGIHFHTVPCPFRYGRIVASAFHSRKELGKFREMVFRTSHDHRFNEIKKAAGGNKDADVFHILSAERAGLDWFLTTDRRLVNSLNNQRAVPLEIQLLYPSELLGRVA